MSSISQRSFAGGELSPSLHGRTDQAKYATGLRTARNVICLRHGGIANRAGTQYVAPTKANGYARLLRFVFSPDPDQVYVLEFGDRYIRFYQDGGQVVVESAPAWVVITGIYDVGDVVEHDGAYYYAMRAHTASVPTEPGVGVSSVSYWHPLEDAIYEVPTPYLEADLDALQYVQSGDVVTIVHPNYAVRELSRTDHTQWVLTEVAFGPGMASPTNLVVGGGSASTTRWWAVTAVDAQGRESLPVVTSAALIGSDATPVTLTWDPAPNAVSYNIYRSEDGSTYGQISLAGGNALAMTDTSWGTPTESVTTMTTGSEVVGPDAAINQVLATAVEDKASNGDYLVEFEVTFSVSGGDGTGGAKALLYYKRGAETPVLVGEVIHLISQSTLGGHAVVPVPDNGYDTLEFRLIPVVYGDATSDPGVTFEAEVTGLAVSWQKGSTAMGDRGADADLDLSPPVQGVTFDAVGRYPSAVTYYQQRRLFAASSDRPETVWGSRTGDYANFTTSMPLLEDDAVSWSLVGRQVNEVQHLVDLDRLRVFTTSGIHRINGDEAGTLKPTAIAPLQEGYNGASELSPINISTAILYVQARGTVVRDFRPDAGEGQRDRDLTIFANHLFDGYTIVSWAYQEVPQSIVWAVRSDGALLSLTYLREHELWGWTRHDTDGAFEQVIVVPEGHEDRVYVVVRREIDGDTVRYVERMAVRTITQLTDVKDLVFLDASLSYDGRAEAGDTIFLSGGTQWDQGETITVTRTLGGFVSGDIGNEVHVYDADGALQFRVALETFSSGTVMTGRPSTTIPVAYRSTLLSNWGRAVDVLSGLAHLEGKDVAVFGDGAVLSSPYNQQDYPTVLTVEAGEITLPQPAAVVHVGLPYFADLETLDIDTASGPSVKTTKVAINKVHLQLEASRGFWAGARPPSDDDTDPLEGLEAPPMLEMEDAYGVLELKTGTYTAVIEGRWNTNGRVFIRQPDPVPLTVLAAIPEGYLNAPR